MTDWTGFKVGAGLGLILGAFAVGVLHDVPETKTETRIVRVPEVHTKRIEVPGPTKYIVSPYPKSCVLARDEVRETWQMSRKVIRLSEIISHHVLDELIPNAIQGENLESDSQFVLDKSNQSVDQLYKWEDAAGMAKFYLEKCADEIESAKNGTLPDETAGPSR